MLYAYYKMARSKISSNILSFATVILILNNLNLYSTRSVLRPAYKKLPKITAYWDNKENTKDIKKYSMRDTHLQLNPIFNCFNYDHFISHQIPQGNIKYKDDNKYIKGSILCSQIDKLIKEINQKKKKYKHFKLLKSKDFNQNMLCGVIILKFKDHPFVLKVFIENPKAFVQPFCKGWQPACFYVMNGGISRYMSGFSRIPNLEKINNKIQSDSYWHNKIITPRKWYYLPKNTPWFVVEGHNIGPSRHAITKFPEVYAIIADAIDKKKELNIFSKKDRELGLKLSKFFGNRMDAHIDNFVIENNSNKIALIDTEHFPSMVGLTKELKYSSYSSWYSQLCKKFISDKWSRSKKYRKSLQNQPQKTILPYF